MTNEYLEAAQALLECPDAEDRAIERVRLAEADLAKAEAAHDKVVDYERMVTGRCRHLNKLAVEMPRADALAATALLDEGVFGDPPIDEFSVRYDLARARARFIIDSLARCVEYHQPIAIRGIKAANVAVALATYGVRKAHAVFSHVRRAKLLGPVLEAELCFEVKGGVTQAAVDAANAALQEVGAVERELAAYDASLRARGIDPTGGKA